MCSNDWVIKILKQNIQCSKPQQNKFISFLKIKCPDIIVAKIRYLVLDNIGKF